ncbi:MAG: hypothetical protein K2X27_01455, partial [Candidatus Obscuribacterales bacterium]|nr:hypothetical protein [Candidatus Obscuribacterales bacterium]
LSRNGEAQARSHEPVGFFARILTMGEYGHVCGKGCFADAAFNATAYKYHQCISHMQGLQFLGRSPNDIILNSYRYHNGIIMNSDYGDMPAPACSFVVRIRASERKSSRTGPG